MYLKELEISGFKSFAKKTKLSFTSPITAIVGPNGSGKSNVAEAFRFALGEQSLKSLRGKRGEDLIFSGTAQAPRSNRAGVKVVFDNAAQIFNVAFPEVSIERTVFRDGVNEYRMNESKVRLKDVHELLASANIGQSGHHIISQGEADRILSAPPKERRVMIEEALGLRVYKYKKEEAEQKLGKTQENIEHIASLRRELKPHLRFLEKQVEKIERARELRNELIEKCRVYFAHEHDWITKEKKRLTHELAEPEKRLEAISQERASLGQDVKKPEVDRSGINEAEEALRKAQDEERAHMQELGRVEGALEVAKEQAQEPDTVSVPQERLRAFKQDIVQVRERAEEADTFTQLRGIVDSIFGVVDPLLKEFVSAPKDTARIDEMQGKREVLQQHIDAAKQAVDTARKHLSEAHDAVRKQEQAQQQQEHRALELAAEEAKLQGTVAHLRDQVQNVARLADALEREHAEALGIVGRGAVEYADVEIGEVSRAEQEGRLRDIERLKIRIEELGGGGEDVVKEYEETKERDAHLEKEVVDLEQTRVSLETLIADLEKELVTSFNDGLVAINEAFNEFFTTMFGGGSARLVRVSNEDEEEEIASTDAVGIDIALSVPGKRVKGLVALSGGERALTSIALIFAMSQVNPPPFLILDETDAALDEANSKRYGDMIETLAKRSQLILITHNRETMSRAGVLYGVTMQGDGISKLLSIKFEDALAVAK